MQTAYIQVLDRANQPLTDIFYAEHVEVTDRNARSQNLSFKVWEPDDALIMALYPREEILDQQPFPIRKLVLKDRPDSTSYTILKHAVLTAFDVSNMDMTTPEGTEELNCSWVFCERSLVLDNEEIRVEAAPPYADRMHEWHDEYMPWREVENEGPGETIRRGVSPRPGRENKVIWLTDGF
jgi:hypothetical protein